MSREDEEASAFVGRVRDAVGASGSGSAEGEGSEGATGSAEGVVAAWARALGSRVEGAGPGVGAQVRVLVDALCGTEEGGKVLAAKSVEVFDALFGVFEREKQRGPNPRMGATWMRAAGEILAAMGARCSGREMVTLLSEELNRYRTTDACRLCLQALGPVVEGLCRGPGGATARAYQSALPPVMSLARTTLRLPLVASALTGGLVRRKQEEDQGREAEMDSERASHERWGWASPEGTEELDEASEIVEHLGVLDDTEVLFRRLLVGAANDEDRYFAAEATLGLLMRASYLASRVKRAAASPLVAAGGASPAPPPSPAHLMARRLARTVCYASGISLAHLMDADAWGSAVKTGWTPRAPGVPVDRVRPPPSVEERRKRQKDPYRGKLLLPQELKRCLGLCACMVFLDGLDVQDDDDDEGGGRGGGGDGSAAGAYASVQAAAPWAPDFALAATLPGLQAMLEAEDVPWLAERGLRLLQFHRGRCAPEAFVAALDTSKMRAVLASLRSLLWSVREDGAMLQEVLAEFRFLLDTLKFDWTLALRHLVALMDSTTNAYVKSLLVGLVKDHLFPPPPPAAAAAVGGPARQPPPADLEATRLPRGGGGGDDEGTSDESVAEYVRGLVKAHLHAGVDLARDVEACVSACNLCRFVCLRDRASGTRIMLPGGAADWEVLRRAHVEPLLDAAHAQLRILRGIDPKPVHPEPWQNEPDQSGLVVPDAMLELRLDALAEGLRALGDLDLF